MCELQQDQGGNGLDMDHRFTSFVKARLVCDMVTAPSTVPYVFNEICESALSA